VTLPAGNRAVVAPIYQSVKFEFEGVEESVANWRGAAPGFNYLRSGNPNARQLELTVAGLQERADALVCASGIGVIANTLIGLTQQGDHVLGFVELYGPTRNVIRRLLGRFGVTHTLLSIEDLAGIERVLATTPTRLVMLESPTNPIGRIADLAAITALARRHGALTVLDNTLAGLHQHGRFEIDYYVHSLTKFAAGHGDVMGGAVIADAPRIAALRPEFNMLGCALDPHAAFLIQRGLKTYAVRYREHCHNAQRVAEFLATHPAVARVYYAGLSSHPGHALARAQMIVPVNNLEGKGYGGAQVRDGIILALAVPMRRYTDQGPQISRWGKASNFILICALQWFIVDIRVLGWAFFAVGATLYIASGLWYGYKVLVYLRRSRDHLVR